MAFLLDIRCRLWEYSCLSISSISDWRLHTFSVVYYSRLTRPRRLYLRGLMLHVPLRYHHFLGFKWESIFACASLCSAIWRRNKKDTRAWVRKCEREMWVSQGAENKDSNVNRWTWHGWFTCVENLWSVLWAAYERRNQAAIVMMGKTKRSMSTSIRWIHVVAQIEGPALKDQANCLDGEQSQAAACNNLSFSSRDFGIVAHCMNELPSE